jgi:uncharacterized delta-60 repeat protein
MVRRALAAIPLAVVASVALGSPAGPGQLDPTFSGDGWVRSHDQTGYLRGPMPQGAEDVELQPDGMILSTGELHGNSEYYFGAYRWTAGGDLDASFGEGGWAVTNLTDSLELPHAVAVQPDGKIIVAGEASCSSVFCFTLVRFTAAGALDPTFGRGGVVLSGGRHCSCGAYDVEVLRDGRIVAIGSGFAGGYEKSVFLVARYLPNGRLDRSFGQRGWAWARFPGTAGASTGEVQPDGRIVLAGSAEGSWSTRSNFAVARLLPNGRPDRSFSRDGHRIVTFWSMRSGSGWSLDLQRNGRIVVTGTSAVGYPRSTRVRIGIVRLKRNGSLDRSFARRGRTLLRPARYGGAGYGVAVQRDGRIVVTGSGYDDEDFDSAFWVIARYRRNGRLDRSFGSRGIAVGDFGTGIDWAGPVALQPDGRIVVAGEVYKDQALARYR